MKPQLLPLMFVATALLACNKQTYSLPDDVQKFDSIVKYNSKVDILLMVDDSGGMSTYQGKLADQMPSMINSLNQKGLDYRIVVVTSDMQQPGSGGKFVGNPKVLTKETPNLPTVLTNRVKQGNFGSDNERGLQSIKTALTIETGFLRPDAMLAIIALSNEDDHSPDSAATFRNFFDQIKPKIQGYNGYMQSWMVNFIGLLDVNSPCSSALDGYYKEPGLDWMYLADASGGSKHSICQETMVSTVANIEKRIVEAASEFVLERKPKVETIVVTINGVVIPRSTENGWDYNSTRNSITFYGTSVPGPGANISVDFAPAEAI